MFIFAYIQIYTIAINLLQGRNIISLLVKCMQNGLFTTDYNLHFIMQNLK